MRSLPKGGQAREIGTVVEGSPDGDLGQVTIRTLVGSRRIVDMRIGEQLPRIC